MSKNKRIPALVQTAASQQEKRVIQRAASMAEVCLITDLQMMPGMPKEEREAFLSFITAMHNLAGGVKLDPEEAMSWGMSFTAAPAEASDALRQAVQEEARKDMLQ